MPYKDSNKNRECRLAWQKRNRTKVNAYKRKRRAENSEVRAKESSYTIEYQRKKYKENSEFRLKESFRHHKKRQDEKVEALVQYGKNKSLQCCWENCNVDDPDMLSLDHVNNDGAIDREIRGTGINLYRTLKKEGYPEGFQTLCFNHQMKKEMTRLRNKYKDSIKERIL
jgi:hypothetical protein